jgi:hypothetical protein
VIIGVFVWGINHLLYSTHPELRDLTDKLNQDLIDGQSPVNQLRKLDSVRANFAQALAVKDELVEYDLERNKFTVAEVAEWLQKDEMKKAA